MRSAGADQNLRSQSHRRGSAPRPATDAEPVAAQTSSRVSLYAATVQETHLEGLETPIATPPRGEGHTPERLRVLVVTVAAGGVGGMQRHTHDLVRGLVAAGHDVEVICPAAAGLASDLYGARWTLLDTTGRSDPAWPAKVVSAYQAGRARAAFDVVHSESTSAAPLARAGIEPPIAITYHGNYLGLAKAHLRRGVTRPRSAAKELRGLARLSWAFFRHRNTWLFRDCEAMVVSRQQLRDTARSGRASPARFHVVPNGVDVALFAPGDRDAARRSLGLGNGILLATVGRLNHEKGFDVALRALARLARDEPELRLLVVGDGEERRPLERLALRLGVADRVELVGAQPHERVAAYLVASDAFLFPTRRDEAGPLVLPQAMACGLPVVASRIGGITEVLQPDDGDPVGILVRPGSVDELAAAVRRLVRDPELRAALGARARERAVREYALETMIERTIAVYRTAIARHAARRA
jgi:glycosyltransferase involved in cell wall biosynthesis